MSNLPIEAGDPIVALLIHKSPFDNSGRVHPTDLWVPFVLPLYGEYDSYGRPEAKEGTIQGEEVIIKQWLDTINSQRHPVENRMAEWSSFDWKDPVNDLTVLFTLLHEFALFIDDKSRTKEDPSRTLPVEMIMARRDVWDMALGMPLVYDAGYSSISYSPELAREHDSIPISSISGIFSYSFPSTGRSSWVASTLRTQKDLATLLEGSENSEVGPILDLLKRSGFDPDAPTPSMESDSPLAFNRLSQLIFIQHWMRMLRRTWVPTTGQGSQQVDYSNHLAFLKGCANIISPLHEKEIEFFSESD